MSTSFTIDGFKGDIVTEQDPGYNDAISRWAKNAKRLAHSVVFPRDSHDVSAALKYARANGLSIAVKGGGHNAAGASSIDGGMVIDLSRYLDQVRVDPGKKLGYVGGGAVWKTVDAEAIKHGLATVGGTVNHVRILSLAILLLPRLTGRIDTDRRRWPHPWRGLRLAQRQVRLGSGQCARGSCSAVLALVISE